MILHSSAFDLFRLGRHDEAVQAFRAAERHYRQENDYEGLVVVGWALNQLHLLRGDIPEAVEHVRKMVRLADRLRDPAQMTGSRILYARARAQAGRLSDQAFNMLYPRIVSLRDQIGGMHAGDYALGVYALFDVLLSRIEPEGAPYPPVHRHRIDRFVAQVHDNLRMLSTVIQEDAYASFAAAIADLMAGKTLLVRCASGTLHDWSQAEASLSSALSGFTMAAMQEYVAYALLARATLKRHQAQYVEAEVDLSDAYQTAIRAGMRLHQADCCLEQACLCAASGDCSGARLSLDRAAQIIESTEYHRRDAEVVALRAYLASLGAT